MKTMRDFMLLITLLLCLMLSFANAQSNVLDQKVTINYKDAKLKDVLIGLEKRYGVSFYYANNMIPVDERVNINVKDQSFRFVLNELFKGKDISFVEMGDRVVLKKAPKSIRKEEKTVSPPIKKQQNIDNTSREEVDDNQYASLEKEIVLPVFTEEERSTVPVLSEEPFSTSELSKLESDSTYNSKSVDKVYETSKTNLLKSYMAKMDSLDKVGDIGSMQDLKEKFNIAMKKLKYDLKILKDKIVSQPIQSEEDSIQTHVVRPFQFTVVPPVGTNGVEAGTIINNTSINLLTGYAYALDGFEYGGLVNIEKAYVRGTQIAGISNVVGAETKGVQIAGISNTVGSEMKGTQISGIVNIVGEMVLGTQVAGIANINGDSVSGAQVAGIANINGGSMRGAQIAGIANVNDGTASGAQIAGIANVNEGSSRGIRVAGIANITDETHKGVQIAGVINVAERVRGSQIGFINIADTVTGVTIGLINIVKNGYNKFELYGSEGLYTNFAFKFGTRGFHTIAAVGVKPQENFVENSNWGYGLGFGSVMALSPKSDLNFDLMSYQIIESFDEYTDALNLLNQFKVQFATRISKGMSIFAGPSFNVMVSDYYNAKEDIYGSTLVDNDLFNKTYKQGSERPINLKMWVGVNAGIRF